MTIIHATTMIDAPREVCFSLSLSIDLELLAVAAFDLKAVGGVTSGKIGFGERVTWEAKQFGMKITHTTEITGFDDPSFFEDSMVAGLFSTFRHKHYFQAHTPAKTLMRDVMCFDLPLVLTGVIAERLIVKRRLEDLLSRRNILIKRHAELGTTLFST